MAGYNRIIIMGNLTRDPELKQLSSGQSVCRLSLASNRQFKNRQTGLVVQEVCFVDVDVWGAQADSCQQYLQKGRAVLVEGRLKQDSWQDNDGQKRSKHLIVADRVVFLSTSTQLDTETDQSERGGSEAANVSQNLDSVVSQPASTLQEKSPEQTVSVAAEEKTGQANQDKTKPEFGSGEVNFKDQKPFEDDLPF